MGQDDTLFHFAPAVLYHLAPTAPFTFNEHYVKKINQNSETFVEVYKSRIYLLSYQYIQTKIS